MASAAIITAIEDHFHITITDAEAEKTHTVSDLVQLVADQAARRSGV